MPSCRQKKPEGGTSSPKALAMLLTRNIKARQAKQASPQPL
jgi:hypothetical protein